MDQRAQIIQKPLQPYLEGFYYCCLNISNQNAVRDERRSLANVIDEIMLPKPDCLASRTSSQVSPNEERLLAHNFSHHSSNVRFRLAVDSSPRSTRSC